MGWGNWVAYPGGKEGEGGSPGCVKGKPWQPQPETAVALHLQTAGEKTTLVLSSLFPSHIVRDPSPGNCNGHITQARTLSDACPRGLCPKACQFTVSAIMSAGAFLP